MGNYRTTVTLTDHMKQRVQAYADAHGATIAGALVALAARTLAAETVTCYVCDPTGSTTHPADDPQCISPGPLFPASTTTPPRPRGAR